MRLLIVGGSGHVGRLVVPVLAQSHAVRVFDLQPFPDPSIETIVSDASDLPALRAAMPEGEYDALIYMALGHYEREGHPWASDAAQNAAFDINVKALYFALTCAQEAGIRHTVYTSSMSVYHAISPHRGETRYFVDEELEPDARDLYGLTKRLGEEVCRAHVRRFSDASVNALRLCLPVADEQWLAEAKPGEPTIKTAAADLARALLAALELRAGFQAFSISGDYEEKLMRMTKAKALLGWSPRLRPAGQSGEANPSKRVSEPMPGG